MRKVVATINGFEQELYDLTRTDRETLSELGRLKNNIASEYEFYFDSKRAETRAELPIGCEVRFDTILLQMDIKQDIIAETLVNVHEPKLTVKFLYSMEYETRVRSVSVHVFYNFNKTVIQNIEFAYERFQKVMMDIVDRDKTFWEDTPLRARREDDANRDTA